jgi:hypothetical protein
MRKPIIEHTMKPNTLYCIDSFGHN